VDGKRLATVEAHEVVESGWRDNGTTQGRYQARTWDGTKSTCVEGDHRFIMSLMASRCPSRWD
jgi:hypothetical protein